MTFGAQVDETEATKIIHRAVDLGVNFIDTANTYSKGKSEKIVGKAIKEIRENIVLATKVRHQMGSGPNDEGLSRKHIMHAIEESLSRLDTDYIDVYYVHRPSNAELGKGYVGQPVPLEETLGALTDLVRSGKVRYLGCSNFPAWLHCRANWISDSHALERFVVAEPRYNLMNREIEREIIPFCTDQGIGIAPYSPLAGGVLTGKYESGSPPPADSRGATNMGWIRSHDFDWEDPRNIRILKGLEEFCQELGRTMGQVALAWLLANPAVTAPIIGASDLRQLEENIAATELSLSKADLDRIDQISPPKGPYLT